MEVQITWIATDPILVLSFVSEFRRYLKFHWIVSNHSSVKQSIRNYSLLKLCFNSRLLINGQFDSMLFVRNTWILWHLHRLQYVTDELVIKIYSEFPSGYTDWSPEVVDLSDLKDDMVPYLAEIGVISSGKEGLFDVSEERLILNRLGRFIDTEKPFLKICMYFRRIYYYSEFVQRIPH